MATTYGYGGEFSSDEDIDRIEARQQQSKFQDSTKPDKRQLEATIEAIRTMPNGSDVVLTDELLAGLLEYYKTQRGPIVDSTRALYKKIVLRLIRGEQPGAPQASNGDHQHKEPSNGVATNNNNMEQPPPSQVQHEQVELASSDEDEPMLPADTMTGGEPLIASKRKLDPRVVYSAPGVNTVEPMEVDTADAMMMRLNKQIDLSSTDDDDDDDNSDSDDTSDEDDSHDSELLDVTPIKPVASSATSKLVTQPSNQKTPQPAAGKSSATDFIVRKRVTTSTPNKVNSSEVKKPYTRSQRVTTRASSSAVGHKSTSATKQAKEDSIAPAAPLTTVKTARRGASGLKFVLTAAIVISFALVLYYFRFNLKESTDNMMRGIKF